MSTKDNHRNCEVCGERERRSSGKVFYAAFPLNLDRCKEWLKLVGKESLLLYTIEKLHKLKFVCQRHFDKKFFNKKRNRLKRTAVPTLNLTRPPLTEDAFISFSSVLPAISGSGASKNITNENTNENNNVSNAPMDLLVTPQSPESIPDQCGSRTHDIGTILSVDIAALVDILNCKEERISNLENELRVAHEMIEELRRQLDTRKDNIESVGKHQPRIGKFRTRKDWLRIAEDLFVENCKLKQEVARLNSLHGKHAATTTNSATTSTTCQPSTVLKITHKPLHEKMVCSSCGILTYHLKKHMITHEAKEFKCQICKKEFHKQSQLDDHMRYHTGERTFMCSECGQGFFNRRSLASHTAGVHENKSVECSICSKKFKNKDTLRKHLDIHENIKRHSCNVCGMAFRRQHHLKAHMVTHTGERCYSCEICAMDFPYRINLNSHVLRDHNVDIKGRRVIKFTVELLRKEMDKIEQAIIANDILWETEVTVECTDGS